MTRRIIAGYILVCTMFLCLYGCVIKEKNKGEVDDNETVVLKWAVAGLGEQKDTISVWKKFNEELQKYLPGTKVEFEYFEIADYGEKWKLMSSSQEDLDIVWTGYMIDYVSDVKKGCYMPLEDLIEKYAPSLKEEIPENMLALQRVDGKLYSIPSMQQMVSYVSTLSIDVNMYEKYKDYINPEELAEFFASHDKMDEECWDKIEEYIELLYKNGDLPNGISGFDNHAEKGYEWVRNPYKIEDFGEDYIVKNYYRTPEYKLFVDTYSDWYKKGYIRKDVLKTELNNAIYNISGKGGYLVGQGYFPSDSEMKMAENKVERSYVNIPFSDTHYIPSAAAATSTAISSNCKNPERAIKLIELMNTEKGKDLYNLLVYGIEGIHYTKSDDERVMPVGYSANGTPTKDSPYGQYKWALGNTFNAYEVYSEDDNKLLKKEFIKKVNDSARSSKIMGFKLNTEPIKDELKQIDAVVEEYKTILNSGAADDAESLYNEFIEKLIKAGDDKVVAEINRQIQEWRKTK